SFVMGKLFLHKSDNCFVLSELVTHLMVYTKHCLGRYCQSISMICNVMEQRAFSRTIWPRDGNPFTKRKLEACILKQAFSPCFKAKISRHNRKFIVKFQSFRLAENNLLLRIYYIHLMKLFHSLFYRFSSTVDCFL